MLSRFIADAITNSRERNNAVRRAYTHKDDIHTFHYQEITASKFAIIFGKYYRDA